MQPYITFNKAEIQTLSEIELRAHANDWIVALKYGMEVSLEVKSWPIEKVKDFVLQRAEKETQQNEICKYKIIPGLFSRPGNILNMEIGERCTLKTPWNGQIDAKWLYSGGSPLVLGCCDARCPKKIND